MNRVKFLIILLYLFSIISCEENGINDSILKSFQNSTGPEFSKDSKRIVYSKTIKEVPSGRGSEIISEIFISDIYGRNTRRLTNLNGHSYKPIFSPNDFYIYYQFEKDDNIEIYRTNYDGSNRIRLTDNAGHDFIYEISHDGSKILFYSERDNLSDLYIMDNDGKNIKRLTYIDEYIERAEFIPDDSQIIYSYGNQIYKMNVDGSNIINLMQENETGYLPSLSYDGSKIVYLSFQQDWDIYIMDIDGKNKINLTDNNVMDSSPSFSPNGNKIVFHSDRDGNVEIYIMNSDGSEQKRLTQNEGYDEFPKFSPDGSKIAYRSEHNGNWYIYVMNIDDSNKLYLIGE